MIFAAISRFMLNLAIINVMNAAKKNAIALLKTKFNHMEYIIKY
jgi:hypothetical protein